MLCGAVQLQAKPTPETYEDFDRAVVDWVTAVEAAGSSVSYATQIAADRLVRRAKSAGLWSRVLMWHLCAGTDLTASLVRLVVPAGVSRTMVNHNFVAGDYEERGANGGLKGDGTTKYLDTLIDPVACGFSKTSLMLWAYCREQSPAGTTRYNIGQENGTDNRTHLGWTSGGTREGVRIAQGSGASAGVNTALIGFLGGGTNGTENQRMYHNGEQVVGEPPQAADLVGLSLYAHAVNRDGAASARAVRRLSQILITSGLSDGEVAALNSIVQEFETALGRNV